MNKTELIQAIETLHGPRRIYDECDHTHTEADVEAGRAVVITELGLTCEDGYLYTICRDCCTDGGGYQTELCADYHSHDDETPYCSTNKLLIQWINGVS